MLHSNLAAAVSRENNRYYTVQAGRGRRNNKRGGTYDKGNEGIARCVPFDVDCLTIGLNQAAVVRQIHPGSAVQTVEIVAKLAPGGQFVVGKIHRDIEACGGTAETAAETAAMAVPAVGEATEN